MTDPTIVDELYPAYDALIEARLDLQGDMQRAEKKLGDAMERVSIILIKHGLVLSDHGYLVSIGEEA